MLLEELHDQSAALVQRAAQRGVGNLVVFQLPQYVLAFRSWGGESSGLGGRLWGEWGAPMGVEGTDGGNGRHLWGE